MKLTADQQAEIERQRQADPQTRSFRIVLTPRQRNACRRAVAEEAAGREENLDRVHKLEAAEREATLSGAVRRAISQSHRTPHSLAAELGIPSRLLTEFREGVAPLPSDVIDKLIAILELDVVVAGVT